MRTSTLAALCAAAALALGALVAVSLVVARGGGDSAGGGEHAFAGPILPPGVKAPELGLPDQDGRVVRMSAFRGKPVIVSFLYTHCKDSCPAQAQQIKGAMNDLGHDVPALAISVDPARDTPRSARHFLAEQGMTGRIRFVLGSERRLARVWKAYAIAPQRPRHEHQSWLTLVDGRGMQRVGWPGADVIPEQLAHDLRILERG